jgi:hypothetical protein
MTSDTERIKRMRELIVLPKHFVRNPSKVATLFRGSF